MKLVLDLNFDHGSWPDELSGRSAVVATAHVGPLGFLDRLETALGLGGLYPGATTRAAALIPVLQRKSGFWDRSLAVDPLHTAEFVLAMRDQLMMCGWTGQGGSERLAQLAEVRELCHSGLSDRFRAVEAACGQRSSGIDEVLLYDTPHAFPQRIQAVLQVLQRRGTKVSSASPRLAEPPTGDLLASRETGFKPRGDGSLQLLRSGGPLATAELVASWISTRPKQQSLLVIGADPVLDRALRRHGLPTTGAKSDLGEGAALQLLSLLFELLWSPVDPQRAVELFNLALSPIPRGIRARLVRRLHEWPSLEHPGIAEALQKGLDQIEDRGRRKRVADRIQTLLKPLARVGEPVSVDEIRRRNSAVLVWANGLLAAEPEAGVVSTLQQLISHGAALGRLLELSGLSRLTRPTLERFVSAAISETSQEPTWSAQAGIHALERPGCVVGPVDNIVWWDFSLESSRALPLPLVTPREAAALAAQGVHVPDSGAVALIEARQRVRPLLSCRRKLLLACPRHGVDGAAVHPHPLWDEIAARVDISSGDLLHRLVVSVPDAGELPFSTPKVRRLPRIQRRYTVEPATLPERKTESPNSLERLVGCSFSYLLRHRAGVRRGLSQAVPGGDLLLGRVSHEILALLLPLPGLTAEQARTEAQRLVREQGPSLAAPLFRPGSEKVRADLNQTIGQAAHQLLTILKRSGFRVGTMEQKLSASFGDGKRRLEGRADLVLDPPGLIDFKWSRTRDREREIRIGTAVQLACYAHQLHDQTGGPPPVAYFILVDQRMLTSSDAFNGVDLIAGPDGIATWYAFEEAAERALKSLERGAVEATGNPQEDPRAQREPALLRPPCRFCPHDLLCGRAFSREERWR